MLSVYNNYAKGGLVNRIIKSIMIKKSFPREYVIKVDNFKSKKEWENFIFSLPDNYMEFILLDIQRLANEFPEIALAKRALIDVELGYLYFNKFCSIEGISIDEYDNIKKNYMLYIRNVIFRVYKPVYTISGVKICLGIRENAISVFI